MSFLSNQTWDEDVERRLQCLVGYIVANAKEAPTTVVDAPSIWREHIADSAVFFDVCEPGIGASLVDLGAGAGFPSLVIAAIRPDMKVYAVESIAKKCTFIKLIMFYKNIYFLIK